MKYLKKTSLLFFFLLMLFVQSALHTNEQVFAQGQEAAQNPDDLEKQLNEPLLPPQERNVENSDFKQFDPLQIGGSEDVTKTQPSALAKTLTTPGAIISRALQFAIPAAGLILFVMIVWGGFEILTSATGGKKDAGKQRITTAVIGFILLFGAYWIAQIIEVIFGVKIL